MAFDALCSRVSGGIPVGFLPSTTRPLLEMKRKSPGEAAQDFRHIDDAGLARLRRQLYRWSIDNEAALARAVPEMLPGFRNRVAANWNLLLAIAESAGVPWKRAAWQAATAIERVREGFDASLGSELIRNIRSAFEEVGNPACLSSVDLLARLTANPEGLGRGPRTAIRSISGAWLIGSGITGCVLKLCTRRVMCRPGDTSLRRSGTCSNHISRGIPRI
jgi:Protein of unknown function (DUF3631)